MRVLETDHESVLAFVRDYAGSGSEMGDQPEEVLCVFSFNHNPVSVTITDPENPGSRLTDLFGGGRFPGFTDEGALTMTLGTQGFYWLHVAKAPWPAEPSASEDVGGPAYAVGVSSTAATEPTLFDDADLEVPSERAPKRAHAGSITSPSSISRRPGSTSAPAAS